jgi:hypothetical protein
MQRRDLLQEKGRSNARTRRGDIDWSRFWLLEVVILGAPTLIAVIATGGQSPVSIGRVELLLVVLIALTVVNLFLGILGGSN